MRRDGDGDFKLVPAAKGESGFFTSYEDGGRFISYYGDNHPVYAGNVVKAMASAKDGFPEVVALFGDEIAALEAPRTSRRATRLSRGWSRRWTSTSSRAS